MAPAEDDGGDAADRQDEADAEESNHGWNLRIGMIYFSNRAIRARGDRNDISLALRTQRVRLVPFEHQNR